MSPYDNLNESFLPRMPGAVYLATITLAAGVAFAVIGGTSSTNRMEKRIETVVCTATGGLASYAYCNWQEPSSNVGSGSRILAIYYTVYGSPISISIDGTIGVSATVSGSIAITPFTNKATQTGTWIEYISGSLSGSIAITEGNYLRLVTLTDPTAGHIATMTIEYISKQDAE